MKKPKPEDEVKRSRARLIYRAGVLRGEIEQVFTDVESWNVNVRKSDELPIDPDPDGKLRRMADDLDRLLEDEAPRA